MSLDILGLVLACAIQGTPPEQLVALIKNQSQGNLYTIQNKQSGEVWHFKHPAEAYNQIVGLQNNKTPIGVGIAVVDTEEFVKQGIEITDAFDPCLNVEFASRALENYKQQCRQEGFAQGIDLCAMSIYVGTYQHPNSPIAVEILEKAVEEKKTLENVLASEDTGQLFIQKPHSFEESPSLFFKNDIQKKNCDTPTILRPSQ